MSKGPDDLGVKSSKRGYEPFFKGSMVISKKIVLKNRSNKRSISPDGPNCEISKNLNPCKNY